jgi:basic amino acid/polyamine antiporter, APA family
MNLSRELTYYQVLFAGVGNILGAGIYALIGKASKYSQSMTWFSFLLAGLFSYIIGEAYINLSKNYNVNDAEYHLIKSSFNDYIAKFSIWSNILGTIFSCALVSLSLGYYFAPLFGLSPQFSGFLCIIISTLINLLDVSDTANINIIITLIEILGLIIVIFYGFTYGNSLNVGNLFKLPSGGINGLLWSTYLVIFAFLGFESLVKLSEETKESKETIPRAIRDSIIICTVIYILVSISSNKILGWEKLSKSDRPLFDVLPKSLGTLLSISAVASTFNTVVMLMLSNSRIIHRFASRELNSKWLSNISSETQIPQNSVIIQSILTIIFYLLIFDIEKLAIWANLGTIILLFMVVLSSVYKKNQFIEHFIQ